MASPIPGIVANQRASAVTGKPGFADLVITPVTGTDPNNGFCTYGSAGGSVAYRYWRMRITANVGNIRNIVLNEIILKSGATSYDLRAALVTVSVDGGTTYVTSQNPSSMGGVGAGIGQSNNAGCNTVNQVFTGGPGNASSYSSSGAAPPSSGTPFIIQLDLGVGVAISPDTLILDNTDVNIYYGNANPNPKTYTFEGSSDGSTWVVAATVADTGFVNDGEQKSTALTLGPGVSTSCTTTQQLLATPSGGTPGYTYSWAFVSNPSAMTISAGATSATCTFSSTNTDVLADYFTPGPTASPRTAIVSCTVTDSLGSTKTVGYSLSMYHTDETYEITKLTEQYPVTAIQSSPFPGPAVLDNAAIPRLVSFYLHVSKDLRFQYNVLTGATTIVYAKKGVILEETNVHLLTLSDLAKQQLTVLPIVTEQKHRPGGGGFIGHSEHQPTVAAPYYQFYFQDIAGGGIYTRWDFNAAGVGIYGLLDSDVTTGVYVYGPGGLVTSTGGWIQYDLGASPGAVSKVAIGCGVVIYKGAPYGDQTATLTSGNTKLQHSADATTWVDSFTIASGDAVQLANHRQMYAISSTTARYWRVINTAGPLGLTTFQLYA